MMAKIIVFAAYFAALLAVVFGCSMDQITECRKLIKSEGTDPGRVFLSAGPTQFADLCREFDQFNACVNRFSGTCDTTLRSTIDVIIGATHYICHEGEEKYLKHYHCFGDDELNREAMQCVNTLKRKTSDIKSRLMYLSYASENEKQSIIDELCRDTEDYRKCVHKSVSKYCGEEAADFQDEVFSRSDHPAEALGECSTKESDNQGGSPSWPETSHQTYPKTGFGYLNWVITACVIAVIIIIILSAAICRYRKRRNHSTSVENNFVNPLEGAYDPPGYDPPRYDAHV